MMSRQDPPARKRVPLSDIVLFLVISTAVLGSLAALILAYPAARQPAVLLLAIGLGLGFVVAYGADVWRSRDVKLDPHHMTRPPVRADGTTDIESSRYEL